MLKDWAGLLPYQRQLLLRVLEEQELEYRTLCRQNKELAITASDEESSAFIGKAGRYSELADALEAAIHYLKKSLEDNSDFWY